VIARTKLIPDGKKELKKIPIINYLDAEYLYYPITSQRCPEGESCVIGGQFVKVGEVIGTRMGAFFEQPIHSTVSGEVVGHEKHYDQSGKKVDCLIVKNDFRYEVSPDIKIRSDEEIKKLSKEDLINIYKNAGLVGLGGSAFPTYIKFQTKDSIHTVIANGVECEPKLISDYGLMMNRTEEVVLGLIYAMQTAGALKGIIAVKKQYKELKERLDFTLKSYSEYDIEVVQVGNYYPQGWEVKVVEEALHIKVKQGTKLSQYGLLNFNVSTLSSMYHAVKNGLPVLERLITLSGDAIENMNFQARIGTLLSDLVSLTGGYLDPNRQKVLILGGPMMGTNVDSDDVVLTHTSTSLIVNHFEKEEEEPCIRCSSCILSCPVEIKPVQIMNAYKANDKQMIKKLNVDKCIECGLCSFVCPSKIPLTDLMKASKQTLKVGA
jgi:Na+-translocating ferredoxin:NAD+ oxidoreductase subunit C